MIAKSRNSGAVAYSSAVAASAAAAAAVAILAWQRTRKLQGVDEVEQHPKKWVAELTRQLLGRSVASVVLTNKELPHVPPQLLTISFSGLQHLNLSSNCISTIPADISILCTLTTFNLSCNQLTDLPESFSQLTALTDLDLGRNKLEKVPPAVCELTQLKFLNLMNNEITELPEQIGQLGQLYRLGLKSNKLKTLPPSFGKLASLVELFITDNVLESLPAEFAGLTSLVKLQASFNKLRSLPPEMGSLPNLELMRVAVNEIESVPSSFAGLQKLAWFSLAGNPAVPTATSPQHDIVTASMKEVEPAEVLGEGASGEVFAAKWQGQEVAVKIFRADVSPDGRAQDEIDIALFVDHPNLTRVIGAIESPHALIKERVYGKSMAAKPNFEYLLRCRWPPKSRFSAKYTVAVCQGVASAMQYLHANSICHGDLYAHNVLADEEGNAVLCDYGASFFYHPQTLPYEAHEVRALGLMMHDMVNRNKPGCPSAALKLLRKLVGDCINSPVATRPSFADVVQQLTAIGEML